MDKGKSNDGSEGEKPDKNLWLAAIIVGILLILMLLAIASIAIWKYFKKENTANQNWAGPSPMADGNTQEDMNMNECILGRHRSLSSISTAPIIPNELQAPQKVHVPNMPQEHSDKESMQKDHSKTDMPTLPYISSETTSFSSDASERQLSKEQLQGFYVNDETSLPPPPDELLSFPMPPQIDELPNVDEERKMQPLQVTDVPQSDKHHNHISLFQATTISQMGSHHSTCDIDEQFLPPPPADLL